MDASRSIQTNDVLETECSLLHQHIFNFQPSTAVVHHYIQANQKYEAYLSYSDCQFIKALCARGGDLESVEYFWRFSNSKNALTQKKMVLFSICELFPEYKNHFSNFESNNFAYGFLVLSYYSLRSFFKLIKGALIFFLLKQSMAKT